MIRDTSVPVNLPAVGLACVMSLTGCAFSNEGVVDMRRTAAVPPEVAVPGDGDKSVAPTATNLPLTYKNFSLGEGSRIATQESLSVTLRTAFIKDFFELGINPLRGFEQNGEIAVVANAFEVATDMELDFTDMQSGRLVFFSDDVAKGQFLNFNNLPIYGPKSYSGQPFALRLTIFELDSGSEQAKTLLNTIAKAGSVAYAPASPVLNLLNGVGQSLFNDAHNDTEFRYTMQFNARPGKPSINSFVLEAGNYVFIRMSERTRTVPWEQLELNENRGELFWKSGPGKGQRYLDNTYVVVEINTGGSAKDIDLKQNTFQDLLVALAKADKESAARLQPTIDAVDQTLLTRAQTVAFDDAKQDLSTLNTPKSSLVAKREAAERLVSLLKRSVEANGTLKASGASEIRDGIAPPLDDAQVDFVISRLRHLNQSANNFGKLGRDKINGLSADGLYRLIIK